MQTEPTPTPEADVQAAAASPAPKRRRIWRRLLLGILVTLLAVLAGVVWIISTESGLRFGLYRLPVLANVHIHAKELHGTVWRGFQGQDWLIMTPGADISLSSAELKWQPQLLRQRQLYIQHLRIGQVHITPKQTPPKPDQAPPQLPQSLKLPVQVAIDEISVAGITYGAQKEPLLLGSHISYVYRNHEHRLLLGNVRTYWNDMQGQITLADAAPFALNGQITGQGELEQTPVKGMMQLSGSLKQPLLQGELGGEDVLLLLDTELQPFEPLLNRKIKHLQLVGSGLNPRAFAPGAPNALLTFSLFARPQEGNSNTLDGQMVLVNLREGAADQNAIPLTEAIGEFQISQSGQIVIPHLDVQTLQKGSLNLSGDIDTAAQKLALTLRLNQLQSTDLISTVLKGTLNGEVTLTGAFDQPQARWQLGTENLNSSGLLSIDKDRKNGQQTLAIKDGLLTPNQGGSLSFSGSLNLFQERKLAFKLVSKDLNPQRIGADYPAGRINGDINLIGQLADEPDIQAVLNIPASVLSGVPLRGTGTVRYREQHLAQADLNVLLGRNRILSNGSFGRDKDKLNLDINAPDLHQFGFGLSGAVQAKGFVAGTPQKLTANLNGQAQALQFQQVLRAQNLRFRLLASPDLTQPLDIDIVGNNLALLDRQNPRQSTVIERINATAKGTGRQHGIRAEGAMTLDGKPYRLDVAANGGMADQQHWRGLVSRLNLSGAFNAQLQNPMRLEAGAEKVSMSTANWALMGGSLNLQSFLWQKGKGLTTRGSATRLAISQLANIVKLPVEQNLIIGGDWDLMYGQNMSGYLKLVRQAGDIVVPYRAQKLGLGKLELLTRFQNGRISNQLDIATQYGTGNASLNLAQQFGGRLTAAPISGQIKLDVADIGKFRYFMPVGVEVAGQANVNVALSGSLGNPQFSGTFNGERLDYRDRNSGLRLENGTLRSRLEGQKWLIQSLRFVHEGGGTATVTGSVSRAGNTPDVNISVLFDRFAALNQANRRLVVSGKSDLVYAAKGLVLVGDLKVDKALFDFPKSGMPALDDDVVVVGREQVKKSAATPIDLNLTLDLNDQFRFSGKGLDVLMGGRLRLFAKPGEDVQALGQVNIVQGRYKAYGQDLVVEKGIISFIGPIADPVLTLRAKRKLSPVGAGVEVSGSLNNPRTVLIADEPMSDKDKLSWLILGRASSGEGDDAAMAAAAGAWLAGNINDKIGFVDDLGITSRKSRNLQTGELNPAEQMITVGKHVTSNLYLGYEYGLISADQAVKVMYQISKSFQTIFRVGTQSVSGEVRYSIRFD